MGNPSQNYGASLTIRYHTVLGRVYIDTSTSCESDFYMYELLVQVLFTLRIYQYENLLSDYVKYPTKTSLTDCHAASHKLRFL